VRRRDFEALTFDCYGTLIDWESGIVAALRPWAEGHGLSPTDGALLDAYAACESACQRARPDALYPDILRDTHARIADRFGRPPSREDADRLAMSVGDWVPFDDTIDALKQLKRDHKLVIVSNVDRASFARTNEKLEIEFDAVVTAEQVGAYKPDPRMFHAAFEALQSLGVRRERILHVAQSLYHDHLPAKELGMSTVWVNRPSLRGRSGAAPPPDIDVHPDVTVTTLAEFAAMK
jgi:2-haloalkanoic acid dehalogenase type II